MNQLTDWMSRNWITALSLVLLTWVLLPFLAPVFMYLGWSAPGKAIYMLYMFFCHQLPQRSFFLFGPQAMYSLAEVQAAWANTSDPMVLRQFIGNPEMGWKVAWSDRMVWMYTSIPVFGLLWGRLRRLANGRRLPALPWWGFVLLLLPMAVDGTTHFVGDLAGLGQGFRDSNAWLANLTNQAFSSAFYSGDAVGSFNWLMRLITGLLFGLGIVWFAFPYLEDMLGSLAYYRSQPPFNAATPSPEDEPQPAFTGQPSSKLQGE